MPIDYKVVIAVLGGEGDVKRSATHVGEGTVTDDDVMPLTVYLAGYIDTPWQRGSPVQCHVHRIDNDDAGVIVLILVVVDKAHSINIGQVIIGEK